jgi:outer membrane protein OmpA-like peptidoglycan-associated protein
MEQRPTLMGTVLTLRQNRWDMNRLERNELQPLVPWQKRQIEHILDQGILDGVFRAFFVDQIKDPDPVGVLINRFTEYRATGGTPETKFDQFPLADLELVREYARRVLTAQRWTNHRNVTRSHVDWIQIMLDQNTGNSPVSNDEVFARHLGLRPSPKDRRGLHRYEFTISLMGVSLVLGGFSGSVTVTKTNDRKWGPKKFDIDLWGLNVVISGLDIKLGESWKGSAESYLEWTENDINGAVRFFGVKASAGLDLAKARAGFMHVLGDERMPPLEVLFWDAKLGVPNPDKIAEKMLKKKVQGKDVTLNPRELVKPSLGASVLFGDITAAGTIFERMAKLRKPYDPIDLSRRLPPPEAIGAEAQSSSHFCLDDAQPTPAGVQALRAMCARQLALFAAGGAVLKVIGHADTLGHKIPGHNQQLSQRRADNTVAAIKGILGSSFRVKNVESKGMGDTLAALESKGRITPAPQHRRVEIILNGSLELSLF